MPLRLTPIGGPTILIEFAGLRFITDPTFDPVPAGGSVDYASPRTTLTKTESPALEAERLGEVHAVLLSHQQHSDNLDTRGREFLGKVPLVLTPVQSAAALASANVQGLKPWETKVLTNGAGRRVTITATPARHGPEGCEPATGDVIGFVLQEEGRPGAVYISGDTVWYQGVQEVADRFDVRVAILFMGAARVSAAGPAHLTMTAEDGIRTAAAMPKALLVPAHYNAWKHFSEGREEIEKAFTAAGLMSRTRFVPFGATVDLPVD